MSEMVESISQIFADKVFFVPDYQRGYAWEEKQWNDLWNDLDLLPENRNHFTGTLVLRALKDGSDQIRDKYMHFYKAFDIIDGQQRLTTVVILLKALKIEMQAYSQFNDLIARLQETYLYSTDRNEQPFTKLVLNADSQAFFADQILGLNPGIGGATIRSHARLLGALEHFAQQLKLKREEMGETYPEWLKQLYGKVISQLQFIVYPVESELDAGTIFETMNDRGKPLTELEKVKNYLLYVSGKLDLPDAHDLNRQINETWKFINERLMAAGLGGRANEDQLLRAQWLMVYDYLPVNWDNARSIKARFGLREYPGKHELLLRDIQHYLHTLQDAVMAYCDTFEPCHPGAFNDLEEQDLRSKIVLWSSKLARLGVSASFLPLLMAVRIKASDGGSTYLRTVQLLEKYSFRVFSWNKARSNTGQSSLFQLGYRYFENPNHELMMDKLAELIVYYCPDESFNARFDRELENWYQWGDINYFLYEYEHHLAGGRPVQFTWETLNARPKSSSIEHILPQTPQTNYWLERFNPEQRQHWTHDLANLTLTYDNSGLGNKSFPEKKGAPGIKGTYADSPLFIERELAKLTDWKVDTLQARRDKLVTWALERWHVDAFARLAVDEFPRKYTLERIMALAKRYGVDEELKQVLDATKPYGIYPNAKVKCVVLAPPQNRNLAIGAIWPQPGRLEIGIWHERWSRYMGFQKLDVAQALGSERYRYLDRNQVGKFIKNLVGLLAGEIEIQDKKRESSHE